MNLRRLFLTIYLSLVSTFTLSDVNNNADLFAYLIENNTSSFLISRNGDLLIDEEFKVKKSLKPMSIMFFNLFQHGFVKNRSQENNWE